MSNGEKRPASGRARWIAAAAVVVLAAGGFAGYRMLRGPSGATVALGGSIEAKPAPELPADASRWVNGDPVALAAARGQVLLVEGWHPA